MKKMAFMVATVGFLSSQAFAEESLTLVDNYRGNQYFCSATGSMPTDETCIPSVSDYCIKSTYESTKWCFEKASNACSGQPMNELLHAVKRNVYLKLNGINLKVSIKP